MWDRIGSLILLITLVLIIVKMKDNKVKYEDKVKMVIKDFERLTSSSTKPIVKNCGHIFGLPILRNTNKINLKKFNKILDINYEEKYAVIEGSVYVKNLLDELLKKNWIIQIPPDMVHLTFSGLVAGIGGGSASFKYGFIHETLLEMEVLTGRGEVVRCSRSENEDLFRAVPNSLGTFGYILKMKLKIREAKPYVRVVYNRFTDPKEYFEELDRCCSDDKIDFLDGTIFGKNSLVLVKGYFEVFIPKSKQKSDIMFDKTKVFWKQLEKNEVTEQYFKLYDYLWRWDPDMYYTTMETPEWTRNGELRKFIPQSLLQSTKYRAVAKIIGFEHGALDCNDVFIPMGRSAEFFEWFCEEYKLFPIYICPVRCRENFQLWGECYFCDFGLGYGVNLKKRPDKIEEKLEEQILKFNGRKLLYAPVSCSEEMFWQIFNIDPEEYFRMKLVYDPKKRFLTLYEKIRSNPR